MPSVRGTERSPKEPTKNAVFCKFAGPLTHCPEGSAGTNSTPLAILNVNLDTKLLWSLSRSGGFTRKEMAFGIHWIHGSAGLGATLDVADKRKFFNPSGNRTKIPRSCSPLHSPIRLTLPRLPIIVPIIATSSPVCYYNANIHFNSRHKTIPSTEW